MIRELLSFLAAFLLGLALLPSLARIASRIGLVDTPNRRKVHATPKPLVGGLGIMMSLAVSCLLFVPLSNLRGFYAGAIILIIVGFLDDYKELRHGGKFVAQVLASLIMIYFSDVTLKSFGDLLYLGSIDVGILSVPLTIFCTVGVINAINMVDGLDGLAGGISLIAFLSFSVLAYLNGQSELSLLSLAFSGAVLAFLRYNRPPASMFMGDAGSLSVGFALAFFSIAVTQKAGTVVQPAAALLMLAVPVCDTVTIMTVRIIKQKSPFTADKKHLHHILLRFGFNRKRTVTFILLISAVLSLAAVIGTVARMPDWFLFAVFAFYAAVYTTAAVFAKKLLTAKVRLKRREPEHFQKEKVTMRFVKVISAAARIIRRDRRLVVKVPVAGMFKDKPVSGTMLDLSKKGFSAVFENDFSPGDRISIVLSLPGMPADLSVTAEVVWSSNEVAARRYGFRITSISGPEAQFLKLYLNKFNVMAP
ncbi:MAG TPA: PilZ domain-containing protein [Dissulfurispiraceae bacterium]|nr:PilZ domain-containing protein [Dissulfurispiraceae bacterium]